MADGGGGSTAGGGLVRALRDHLWLIGPLALFALLRIPSFLEPHWYTDEAGYVTTARGLLQGKIYYLQIWNNKPPLQIWTVAGVIQVLGTGEAALHVATFLSGLLTLLAVAYAAGRLLGRRRAAVALVLAAILLGTPVFDAELLLPESLLIAPVTWAGAILLTRVATPDRRRWPLWPAAVGALAAAAVAYQQTAVAETCAFGLILAVVGPATWRRVAVYAGTVAAFTLAWLIPAIATAGAGKVAYALVGFWVPYTQTSWGGGGTLVHLLLPAAVLALLLAATWLRRRDRETSWALWVWAGAALLVPAVARQPYPHFLAPSVAPFAMALSSLRLRRPALAALSRSLAGAGLVAATGLAAVGASVARMDWPPALGVGDHTLLYYYGGAVSVLTRGQSLDTYQDTFDYRYPEDLGVSAWIAAHGLDGSSAVVWSADTWLYTDNQLQLVLPTAPIYNDEYLLGMGGPVAQTVATLSPEIVVTEASSRRAYPDIDSVLAASYKEVDHSGSEIVWLRTDLVAAVMGATAAG